MHPFLFKSLLALLALVSLCIGAATMYNIYGRNAKKQNAELFRKIHRINGIAFILLTLFISFLCLLFMFKIKAEPSARGVFHAVFAFMVLIILCFKVAVANFYRQHYAKLRTAGILLIVTALGMVGTSAGYYLLKTNFGTVGAQIQAPETRSEQKNADSPVVVSGVAVRTDPATISRGRELYESKCHFCHDAYSNNTGIGPGHKGILKNSLLPVSGKQATPENVIGQLRRPYRDMPSFSSLTDEEVAELVSYLNTL